jgi:hypothetical protein
VSDYRVDFAEVKALVTWDQALQYASITGLRRDGSSKLRGLCPFCKAQREFSITETAGKDGRGLFNCFRCKAAGDMLELISRARGNKPRDPQAVYQVASELMEHFGTGRNSSATVRTVPTGTPSPQGGGDSAALLRIAETLQPDHASLEPLGLSVETLRHFSAGWKPRGLLQGKLAIPIHQFDGTLRGYCGQSLNPLEPQQLEFPKNFAVKEFIFNAHRIESGELRIMSDVLSVLQAFEGGETNVVSFLTEMVDTEQTERLTALLDAKGCVWMP